MSGKEERAGKLKETEKRVKTRESRDRDIEIEVVVGLGD